MPDVLNRISMDLADYCYAAWRHDTSEDSKYTLHRAVDLREALEHYVSETEPLGVETSYVHLIASLGEFISYEEQDVEDDGIPTQALSLASRLKKALYTYHLKYNPHRHQKKKRTV